MHIDPRMAEAPGYRTVKSVRKGLLSQFDGSRKNAAQMLKEGMTWQEMIENGFVVAGSPSTVRDMMKEAILDLRVGNVVCLLHVGNMPHWLTMKNMQMFAEEVMPQLKDIYSEWDHSHFWPKGFPNKEAKEAVTQV
jgi:alkanesulfonate monooxygenase SsuD/methylene tetrahydromethanopterin reductase-like flavin-dependent oxidoreductase (luciferase family)